MDRVAVGANHVLASVHAAADVGARQRLVMAAEAGVEGFLRAELGEGDDGRLAAARVDVSLPGTIMLSRSSLLVLEQNILEVIDCGGGTKFDIFLTTGAKASLGNFEMGHGAPDYLVL